MKVKDGFVLREVCGENVIVPTGKRSVEFNGIINVNELGVFLWEKLQEECSLDQLANYVLEEYEATKEEVVKDIEEFIEVLVKYDLLMK